MKLLAPIALGAAGALVLLGAAPANAAGNTIDPGDSLFAVNCDNDAYPDWQLFSVDPATAAATTIGFGETVSEDYFACAGQPAYDAATATSYYIQWHYGDGSQSFLASVDTTTGVSTQIGQFYIHDIEFDLHPFIDALAIGPSGLAYALSEGSLYSVDLSSGEMTYIGNSLVNTYAFALDPTTGIFYAIDENYQLFIVDVSDGTYDYLGDVGVDAGRIYSLQIDGGGMFWVEADEKDSETSAGAGLWSFPLATYATPVYSGSFVDDPFYTEALLIIPGDVPPPPKPQLASTGVDATPTVAVAGLLALAGIALVLVRRRRTT